MLTSETLLNFIDGLESHVDTNEPYTFFVQPGMHKRIFMATKLTKLGIEPRRKLRKVQMRRIVARRRVRRAFLEGLYNKQFGTTGLTNMYQVSPTYIYDFLERGKSR